MTTPEIDISRWDSPGELLADLALQKIALPFWIRAGASRQRITVDRVHGVMAGLRLAMEINARRAGE